MGKLKQGWKQIGLKGQKIAKKFNNYKKTKNQKPKQTKKPDTKKDKPIDLMSRALDYFELISHTNIPEARLLFDIFYKDFKKDLAKNKKPLIAKVGSPENITLNNNHNLQKQSLYELATGMRRDLQTALSDEIMSSKNRLTYLLLVEKKLELFEEKFQKKVEKHFQDTSTKS